jgi:hypothetical protein
MLNDANAIMSHKESMHVLFNQLAIVIGQADLLSVQTEGPVSHAASLIKAAGVRINTVVQQLTRE